MIANLDSNEFKQKRELIIRITVCTVRVWMALNVELYSVVVTIH